MKGWISKRRDMSIKHTPRPKQQSVPELRLRGAASFADRKTSGKNRAEMGEKGKGKVVVAVPCRGFRKARPIKSCASSRVSNKALDTGRSTTYKKVGKKPDREKERAERDGFSVRHSLWLHRGETQGGNRGRGPTHEVTEVRSGPMHRVQPACRPAVPARSA